MHVTLPSYRGGSSGGRRGGQLRGGRGRRHCGGSRTIIVRSMLTSSWDQDDRQCGDRHVALVSVGIHGGFNR